MSYPTSVPQQINPNLQALPISAPVATAQNLQLLNEAWKQGLINADDIKDRLTIKPLQDQVKMGVAKDQLQQLQVAPIQRQQALSAADQQAQLRDLQIQGYQQDISNAPTVADQQKRLRDAQITAANQQNTYTPLKDDVDLDLSRERVAAARTQNETLGAKEQANLEDMQAQAELRKSQAALATSKATGLNTPASAAYENERTTRILNDVDSLAARVGANTVGMGSLLGAIPGTEAKNFQADVASLKANIISNELEQMKSASKTGSGLGRTANAELERLSAALGSLDTAQSPQHFKENLQKIKDSIARWHQASATAGGSAPTGAPPAAAAPVGVPEVGSDAEFNALPAGAQFRRPGDPSGRIWTKQASRMPQDATASPSGATPDSSFRGAGAGSSFDSSPLSQQPHVSQFEALRQDLKNDLERIKRALGIVSAPAAPNSGPTVFESAN